MKSDLDYLEEALVYVDFGDRLKYALRQLIEHAKDIKHEESQKPNVNYDPN